MTIPDRLIVPEESRDALDFREGHVPAPERGYAALVGRPVVRIIAGLLLPVII